MEARVMGQEKRDALKYALLSKSSLHKDSSPDNYFLSQTTGPADPTRASVRPRTRDGSDRAWTSRDRTPPTHAACSATVFVIVAMLGRARGRETTLSR